MSDYVRKRFLPAFIGLLAVAVLLPCRVALAEYVPGEVLITYKEDLILPESDDAQMPEQAIESLDFTVTEELSHTSEESVVLADVPEGTSVEEAVDQLNGLVGVTAQPNYVYSLVRPSLAEEAYGVLVRSGDEGKIEGWRSLQPNLEAAQVFEAWDFAISDGKISVAVIDTGCLLSHTEFEGNVDTDHAWDYIHGPTGGQLLSLDTATGGDDQGHGTHVCGILAARGAKIKGASYDAKIIPIKVLDSSGNGSTSDIVLAIHYAISLRQQNAVPNLRVINLSLGGGEADNDPLMKDAIDSATLNGILCVCAGGNNYNNSTDGMYPSDYDNALSVMGLTTEQLFAGYSDYNEYKDIAAVGTAHSTYIPSKGGGSSYYDLSGTSMATPLVSGVACLVWAVNPDLSANQVRDVLLSTAKAVSAGGSNKFNEAASARVKQVNALAAVKKAQELYGTTPVAKQVAKPQSVLTFTYDGLVHTCAAEGVGYHLEGDYQQTDAGTYTAQAVLGEGYEWSDGDDKTEAITYTWSITKAPLKVAYKTASIQKSATSLPTELEYEGFVNGETEASLIAQGNGVFTKPSIEFPTSCGTSGNYTPGVYDVSLSGGSAKNYALELKVGKLIVLDDGSHVYDIPTAKDLAYNGRQQQIQLVGAPDSSRYTLVGTMAATNACKVLQSGTGSSLTCTFEPYVATIKLTHEGDRWADGSTEAQIKWCITPAPLTLTYQESWVAVGKAIPKSVAVTGFVGGDTADKLASTTDADGNKLVLPRLVLASSQEVPDENLTRKAGSYSLMADLQDTAACATRNYEFKTANPGVLHVCNVVTAPTGKTLTYSGAAQTGVAGGTGFSLSGTTRATAVGSYAARASLQTNYMWSDGARTAKTISWKIQAASLSSASLSSIAAQTYTGSLLSPKPTVTWGGRTLKEGTDYTLTYANNRAVGTATVTARGKGNFTGTRSTTFVIVKPVVVSYRTHVQDFGWQGWKSNGAMSGTSAQAKRLEGIYIRFDSAPYAGGIQYRTHVQGIGWQSWRADGALAGTTGQAKRLEAIQIRLTGEMAQRYDVWYRVHAQDVGWMGWAKNGASAGTATYGRRLEAIQIVVVPKGSAVLSASYGGITQVTSTPYLTRQVSYRTHVQDYGWQSYVYDGSVSGTTGRAKRLEGINISLTDQPYSGGIQYRTHVQNIGWQGWRANGAMSGTSGRSLRLEAIQIQLTGDMAQHYDVWYRVHAQTYGWMGWAKNGASAGTAGYAKRLEGIQIRLVPKGGAAPGPTANAFRQR